MNKSILKCSLFTIMLAVFNSCNNNYKSCADYSPPPNHPTEIKIGNQIWSSVNLNVTHFKNGDIITEAKTPQQWKQAIKKKQPAWCYHANDSSCNKDYGKLYNWYAVNDARGLAPMGWHIPNSGEWNTLIYQLGGIQIAGKKMKTVNQWNDEGNGIDEIGFSALPGGLRAKPDTWSNFSMACYFWSSTQLSEHKASCISLHYFSDAISTYGEQKDKGLSVRCIKTK
jgi:uncharacterized protein (TIGR02145 family)